MKTPPLVGNEESEPVRTTFPPPELYDKLLKLIVAPLLPDASPIILPFESQIISPSDIAVEIVPSKVILVALALLMFKVVPPESTMAEVNV
jgi:hypothetical protein